MIRKITIVILLCISVCNLFARKYEKILVIVADQDEISKIKLPEGVDLLITGDGKVNAALAIQKALFEKKPDLVINFGTCGGIDENLKNLVEITTTIQRDMDVTALGFERSLTPGYSDEKILKSASNAVKNVTCGTGDSFVTKPDAWIKKYCDVVDMELYAIALACKRADIDWIAFKYVSDGANKKSAKTFVKNEKSGGELFLEKLKKIIAGNY